MLEIILLLSGGWVLLFVRLALGSVLIYYSWPRVRGLLPGLVGAKSANQKSSFSLDTLIALINFVGGTIIITGLSSQIVALILALQYLGIVIWKAAKERSPFSDWSHDLLLLSLSLIVMAFGSGLYSASFFL